MMGKYSTFSRQAPKPSKPQGPHDIWRGIGCLMMLIIPAISIALGISIINYAIEQRWELPYQLVGYMKLPDYFHKSSGLIQILGPLTRIPNLYAYISASIMFMLLLGGLVSTLYAILFSFVGPSRYGPTDAPPPRFKSKKSSR